MAGVGMKRVRPRSKEFGFAFSSERTPGTEFAEKLLAKPLPKKPPGIAVTPYSAEQHDGEGFR